LGESVAETCLIIPTYNNARTLPEVLAGALSHDLPVIVVNDGATDNTARVLPRYPACQVVNLSPNQGKGFALAAGFEAARDRGLERAITLDSDMQHDPAEVPRFLEAARRSPDALLVGARQLKAAGAPFANRFGNAMSNCYFRLLSGVSLPDTQSGYRSYPVGKVLALNCPPSRFEYELVVLIVAARSGIPLRPVPISVRYEKRSYVTHFRPVTDFMRIFRAGLRAYFRRSGLQR
jgi:glycosyltransferase involved in cell wall biosynthesis